MAVNYRALVPGGFFSKDPFDKHVPVSIRCNNPGAINGAAWEKVYPGYVDTVQTTPGNKTTIFEAPEFGVAVWWDLLRRYRLAGATTINTIITKYGGGQDYSTYITAVAKATGLGKNADIALDNDQALVAFGRAMFRFEAGKVYPLSDRQIRYGLRLGRAKGDVAAAGPP